MHQLIVNADDFGFTHDVNEGIVEAHVRGILTATTLMANGSAFSQAVMLAREYPSLDVGCHLVLIGGHSLRTGSPLPISAGALLQAIALRRIAIRDELKAQIERILGAGLHPVHLDTHKHTHLLPQVLAAVTDLAREYGIPWVRHPFDCRGPSSNATPAKKRWVSRVIGFAAPYARGVLHRKQCRCTDHFAGFQLTGYLNSRTLIDMLRCLPPGTTELMCHPGRLGDELQHAPTRLKESRQIELDALTDPEVRTTLNEEGVQLVRFRDLLPS